MPEPLFKFEPPNGPPWIPELYDFLLGRAAGNPGKKKPTIHEQHPDTPITNAVTSVESQCLGHGWFERSEIVGASQMRDLERKYNAVVDELNRLKNGKLVQ